MKKKLILFILIHFFIFQLFSAGKTEIPIEYLDLGEIDVNLNEKSSRNLILSLPYSKPEGVRHIYVVDHAAIAIHDLFIDGKRIKGRNDIFADVEEVSEVFVDSIDSTQKNLTINLNLAYSSMTNRIEYLSWPRFQSSNPKKYTLNENSEEVIMTYSILFPDGNESEKVTVMWRMNWM